jgi:glycosyltransferase involved in cell wall biosynthesis
MRIGVNLLYLRPGGVGGSEIYVRSLIKEIGGRRDVDLILFCSPFVASTFAPRARVDIVEVGGREFSQGRRLYQENWGMRDLLRNHPVDVLFSPANFAPALLPVRVPQVATVHDLQHLAYPENFPLLTRAARSVLFRSTFLRCARIIAISEFTRVGILESYALAPGKVAAVLQGVDAPAHPTPTVIEEARARFLPGEGYVCYPARAWPHKNHVTLFRAIALLRRQGLSIPLALSGASSAAFDRLRTLPESLGIGGQVRFLGMLARKDLFSMIAGARALVFPSRFEGFGLPILEAMHLGVPVAASDAASIPEVAGKAALLVPPEDVAAWARAIRRLVEDPVLRATLVAEGRENVKRFSWERCADGTLSVLRAAAERRRPG